MSCGVVLTSCFARRELFLTAPVGVSGKSSLDQTGSGVDWIYSEEMSALPVVILRQRRLGGSRGERDLGALDEEHPSDDDPFVEEV